MKQVLDMRWLVAPAVSDGSHVVPADDDGVRRLDYPFPPEVGRGWLEYLTLADGVKLSRATHRFQPQAAGGLVLAGDIEFAFPEATFHVATIHGGTYLRREYHPPAELTIRPGVDFFRHADRFHVKQMIDASTDSEVWSLVVSASVLAELLGEALAGRLLDGLGLHPAPAVTALPMPLAVSAPLRASMATTFSGGVRKLFAQSKVLEYLCRLADHVTAPKPARALRRRDAVRQLHEELLRLEGKLPTLGQLAARYGMAAKTLNDFFAAEYGQSIYAFITECRLREAHAALQGSDVPMKVLSDRLGYSHVNNFIGAFRKKFGYPPGSLRRARRTSAG